MYARLSILAFHNFDVAEKYGLNKSLVLKWLKEFNCIEDISVSETQRNFKEDSAKLLYYDKKWGRFDPKRRFNVDQVPMNFAIDTKSTYEVNVPKEDRRDHRVWVAHPGSSLEKHQCTLQICISPGSKSELV